MSAPRGRGHPLRFSCTVLRRNWWRDAAADHQVVLTGRYRPSRAQLSHGSVYAYEYRCGCGHVGWSSHLDLQQRAIEQGIVVAAQVAHARHR